MSQSVPTTPGEVTPISASSAKKRKRDLTTSEDGPVTSQRAKAPRLLKLITKDGPVVKSKTSAITPGIKLKTKGKIPKRPSGVGYDSELDDREVDPVILEALVIRMPPGDDCEYVRECINNGSVGVSVLQRGADIRLRFLDVSGRRGILTVRGKQYAFSVVDLPTITEGMKTWDRKNFVKSIDISQLCLVLGRCTTDEEARTYPLPADVNPKNFQYAHGLTAPMKNVRKRRFERTARARLDDIEAVERKVNSLLDADLKASSVSFEVLDHDPRQEDDGEDEYDSADDGEAEEDDGYFGAQVDAVPEPDYNIEDLEAMFDQDPGTIATSEMAQREPIETMDSAAPSTVADASTEAQTPAYHDNTDIDFDDEGPDNDEEDDDEEDDDDEDAQEANDERAEGLIQLQEIDNKVAELRNQLSRQSNPILKKKLAKTIQSLESDARMLRRRFNIKEKNTEDDDEEEIRPGNEESEEE